MKILLPLNSKFSTVYIPLAREIGLYESMMLPAICEEIEDHGTIKDGLRMIARNDKQLKEMFPYCRSIALIRKIFERLQNLGYLYISQNTLFDDECLWYGLNETKLRELKSIIIMSDDEIHDAHIIPAQVSANGNGNGQEKPKIFQVLYGAFLKACHWNNSLNLTSRDRAEVGQEVNALIKRYPDREVENLKLMVLGFDTYRRTVLKYPQPCRPSGISRAWGPYADYCKNVLGNKPPEIPKEWL